MQKFIKNLKIIFAMSKLLGFLSWCLYFTKSPPLCFITATRQLLTHKKRGQRREKRSQILINFEIAFIREKLKYTPSIGIQLSTIQSEGKTFYKISII